EAPVYALGEQTVTFSASVRGKQPAVDEVVLTVSDTVAPLAPRLEQSAAAGAVTLSATPQSEDREPVDAQFFTSAAVPLAEENTSVRAGATADRVPTALTPASGEPAADFLPTTVGTD